MNIPVSVIEDDVPIREILAGWLAAAKGFCLVSQYGDAEQALQSLPRQEADIVLTDIQLLGLSEATKTQFVMLTVYEDSEHIFDALRAGATGYLLKRSTCEELLAALKYVRVGGLPMNSYEHK